MLKSVVYGAGAIGSLLGAKLHRAGHNIVLVARSNHVNEIIKNGLRVRGLEKYTVNIDASTDPNCVNSADFVFLTVKSQDTKQAMKELAPYLGESTPVVSLQNGVRNSEVMAEIIGKTRVIPGVVRFTATYLQPGEVEYTREGFCIIGELDGQVTSRIKQIRKLMSSGIDTVVSTNIELDLWAKLILNLINLPLALTGLGFPRGLKDRHLRQTILAAWNEGRDVVKAYGIQPAYRVLDQLTQILDDDATFETWLSQERTDVETYPSTYQSLIRGTSSESDYLTGEIIRLGEKMGIKTPVNSLLIQKIQNMIEEDNTTPIEPEALWNAIVETKLNS